MEDLQAIASRVQVALSKGITAHFEAGAALKEARALVNSTQGLRWSDWVNENTGISVAYAGQLIKIAEHKVLTELWYTKADQLPRTFDALYALAGTDAETLRGYLLETGASVVRPGMSRDEAADLARRLAGKPPKRRERHGSAKGVRHQLEAAVTRLNELQGDFDGAVEREVEAQLNDVADNRVADAAAAAADPTVGNPELAVLGAVEAHHQLAEADEHQDEAELNKMLEAVPEAFKAEVRKYTRNGARPELKQAYADYEKAFFTLLRLLHDAELGRDSQAALGQGVSGEHEGSLAR